MEAAAGAHLSRLQRLSIRSAWHSMHAVAQLEAWGRAAARYMTLLCLHNDADEQCGTASQRLEHELRASEPRQTICAASVLAPVEHLRSLQCLCLDGAARP